MLRMLPRRDLLRSVILNVLFPLLRFKLVLLRALHFFPHLTDIIFDLLGENLLEVVCNVGMLAAKLFGDIFS